jgi:predicted secreted protein
MVTLIRFVARSFWSTIAAALVAAIIAIAIVVSAFGLRISGGTALYFIIWWTLLFAILPFGVRSQAEAGEVTRGTEPGAPAAPALREKALWTTLVAAVVLVFTAWVLPLAGL